MGERVWRYTTFPPTPSFQNAATSSLNTAQMMNGHVSLSETTASSRFIPSSAPQSRLGRTKPRKMDTRTPRLFLCRQKRPHNSRTLLPVLLRERRAAKFRLSNCRDVSVVILGSAPVTINQSPAFHSL